MPRATAPSHNPVHAQPYSRPISSHRRSGSRDQQPQYAKAAPAYPTPNPSPQVPSNSRAWGEKPSRPSHRNSSSMSSSSGSRRTSENSWQGCRLQDLPRENQRQIDQAAKNLGSWEQLALHGVARGESIPQTRLRETQALIRAADNATQPPSVPYGGPNPPPYIGSTFSSRAHDPPQNAGIPGQNFHHNQGLSSGNRGSGGSSSQPRKITPGQSRPAEGEKWWDDVDVAWEDRFKPVGKPSAGISSKDKERSSGSSTSKGKKRSR